MGSLQRYSDLEARKEILKNYIRNNPACTYLDIRNNTKLKVERVYRSMKEAYRDAGVQLSKNLTKKTKTEREEAVIAYIKINPRCSVPEIQKNTGVNVILTFGSVLQAYKAAGIVYPTRKINWGVANPEIAQRCRTYEKEIANLLAPLGYIREKVKTSAGIADCLLVHKGKKYVVEIKDFRGNRNITMHHIKQLLRYMKALDCSNGLLICPKKCLPKRKNGRNVYIENRDIKIISDEELRGRSTKESYSVQLG